MLNTTQGGANHGKNMASWDRAIRIVLGIIFLIIAFTKGGMWWILGRNL